MWRNDQVLDVMKVIYLLFNFQMQWYGQVLSFRMMVVIMMTSKLEFKAMFDFALRAIIVG